jgi:hypothetical protein
MKTALLPHFNNDLRITGPYLNKTQGRRFVTITNLSSGIRTQKTYAKYLMEVHLNRELSKIETVDHIDRDKLNDTIDNYRIVSPGQHATEDNIRAADTKVICPICKVKFMKSPNEMRFHSKRNHAGPFCGAVCRGKYGASVGHTGKRLPVQPAVKTEYYYPEKK